MEADDISPHSRRAGARRRKHQRRRRTVSLISVLVLVILAASATAYAQRENISFFSTQPAPEKIVEKNGRVVDRRTKLVKGVQRRALTTKQPLRLWIGGDSLAGSLGPGLGKIAADTGVVAPVYESRVSSGLANPGFFNWPKRATSELARLNPEAVAFIIGTNDYPIVSGKQLAGSKWSAAYEIKTVEMMQILVGTKNRTVFWVSPPVMKDSKINNGVRQIGELQRSVARRFPSVVWIDGYSLFDDANGDYATRIIDESGHSKLVRAGDGVHLSPAGGEYLGRAVFEEIDLVWHVTEQADPNFPQRVIETKGSTYIPGTRPSTNGPDTLGPAKLPTGATGTSGASGASGATGVTGVTGSTGNNASTTTTSSSTSTTTTTRPPASSTTSTTRTTRNTIPNL